MLAAAQIVVAVTFFGFFALCFAAVVFDSHPGFDDPW